MVNKVLLALAFSVIALSLIGYQEAFAVTTNISDVPSCEAAGGDNTEREDAS